MSKRPFVGTTKDFVFSCPNIAYAEQAILQFESLAVTANHPRNIVRINGVDIPGGITPGVRNFHRDPAFWKSQLLLVPANVLQDTNVLHIESVPVWQGGGQSMDNFIIDNIVIVFKTRQSGAGGNPGDHLNPSW